MPYHSKQSCWVCYTTCSWNLNASEVVLNVQWVVQMEQFMLVLLMVSPGILYCTSYMHYATWSSSTRVCFCTTTEARQRVQQSFDSAFSAHTVGVLWNSSYVSRLNYSYPQLSIFKKTFLLRVLLHRPCTFWWWLLGTISRKPSQILERSQQLSKDQHYSSP